MIIIGAGFQLQGTTDPNFSRDVADTLADLKSVGISDIDRGHIVFCKANGKHYVFNPSGAETEDDTTGYFRELLHEEETAKRAKVEHHEINNDSAAYTMTQDTVVSNVYVTNRKDGDELSSEVRHGAGVTTKSSGTPYPQANALRDATVSYFDKGVDLYRNGYSMVEDSVMLDNNIGVSVDTDGDWVGAIGITGCHIRRNQTGVYVSEKATNDTINLTKTAFEGNLVDIDCAGNLVVKDCWFGDKGLYERNERGGRRLAIVRPGATITFENCTLAFGGTWRHSQNDNGQPRVDVNGNTNDPDIYDFMFDLLGTDDKPCKVIMRNCKISLANAIDTYYISEGQYAPQFPTNTFMYQSCSEKNQIVMEHCTMAYSTLNQQHSWTYHRVYDGLVRDYAVKGGYAAYSSKVCSLVSVGNGKNYIINGYFDDETANGLFAKLRRYNGESQVTVLNDKTIYGGHVVQVSRWSVPVYYHVPAGMVGKEMTLIVGVRGFNNIGTTLISASKSDIEGSDINFGADIRAGGFAAADCRTVIYKIIPTKEFGKIIITTNNYGEPAGSEYIELVFVKLVESKYGNMGDKYPLYDNTLIGYTFDEADFNGIDEGRKIYNDKLGAWSAVRDGNTNVIVGTYRPKESLPFDGIVDNVDLAQNSLVGDPSEICWDSTRKIFVVKKTFDMVNTYYASFPGDSNYINVEGNDGKAFLYDGDMYIYTYDATSPSLNKLGDKESVLTGQMLGTVYKYSGVPDELCYKTNTVFVIRHDYNLCGKTVTMPAGCTLVFDGGSIKNGTIVGNNTKVDYNGNFVSVMQANITGTWIGIGNTKTKRSGTTAQRPTDLVAAHDIGYMYFDTQLGKAVWASAIGANGEATWVDANYSNISAQVASDLGMIPNDPSAATTNAGILENVLRAGRNLVVDNFYYINGQHVVDYTFSCTGQNGGGFHWVATPGNYQDFCFLITEGGSISLDGLKIVTNVGRIHWNFVYCDMTRGSSLQSQSDNGYVIDMIEVKNCDITGGNFLEILCDNVNYDFADTRYGINKVKIYNNRVHDINQDSVNYYQPTDNSVYAFVFKDCPILLENVVSDNSFLRVNGICVREYIYNSGSFHAANTLQYLVNECPVNIERNVFDNTGLIGDTENYTCLAFIEKFVCIYRNNTITNIITVAPKRDVNGFDGPTYDCYLSCTNLIYENNVCRNIASFHPGTQENPVTSATLFGRAGFAYSKRANDESNGLFSSRKIVNSRFVNNYEEIYNIVSSRINLPAPADENSTLYDVFEGMLDNCVSYFGYATDTFNYQEYRNNYVDVSKARIGITTTDGTELHFVSNKLIAKGLDSTPLHYAASGDISVIEICNNYFDMDSIELIRKKYYNNTYIDTNCNSFIVENNIVKKELRIFNSAEAFRHFKCGIYKFKNNTCLCVPDGSNAPMYRISCSDYGVFEHANVFNNDASHTYIGPVDNCDCELIRKIYRLGRDGTAKANILRIMYNDLIRDPNDATYNTETQYYKVDVSIDDILYKDTFYVAINRASTTFVNEDGSININLTPTLPTSSNDTLTSSGWQSIDSDTQFQFGVDMIKDNYYGTYGYFQLYFKTNLTSTVVRMKAKRVLKKFVNNRNNNISYDIVN